MSFCQHPDCNHTRLTPVEGTTEFCATRNSIIRKQERIDNAPAKPVTPLRKSSPPKRVSDKRKEEMKDYSTLRKDYLKENPVCEANLRECTGVAEEIHHKAKRGTNYLNVETFMAICKNCHRLIEEKMSAEERREQGFLMTVTDKKTI